MYELRDKKNNGIKSPIWKKAAACPLALLLFFICSALLYVTKLATSVQKIPDADISEVKNNHLKEETEKSWMITGLWLSSAWTAGTGM